MSKTKGYVMGLEDKLSQSELDIRAARRKLRGLGVEVMKTHMLLTHTMFQLVK